MLPAAPWEAGAAVSHRRCWNVTQSRCSPAGHDQTAKAWEKPSAAACPRPPAGRTWEPPHIAQHPAGASPHCRGAELSAWESSAWGGRLLFFLLLLFFFSPLFFFNYFFSSPFFFPSEPGKSPSPASLLPSVGPWVPPRGFCCPILQARPRRGAANTSESPAPGTAPAPLPVPQFPHPKGSGDAPRQGAGGVTSGRALRSPSSSGVLLLILMGSGGREGRGGRGAGRSHRSPESPAAPCRAPARSQHPRATRSWDPAASHDPSSSSR